MTDDALTLRARVIMTPFMAWSGWYSERRGWVKPMWSVKVEWYLWWFCGHKMPRWW